MGKVRIRHGENEIEVEGSDTFIAKQLKGFYQRVEVTQLTSAPATLKKDLQAPATKKPTGKAPTPAEFYKSKKRTDGISKVLIFGKYLEQYQGKSEYSCQQVNKVASEAKLSDIHGQYFTNAVRQGLLRSLGKGKYSLSLSAENVLAAMK